MARNDAMESPNQIIEVEFPYEATPRTARPAAVSGPCETGSRSNNREQRGFSLIDNQRFQGVFPPESFARREGAVDVGEAQ
jgi:hypothetical protein